VGEAFIYGLNSRLFDMLGSVKIWFSKLQPYEIGSSYHQPPNFGKFGWGKSSSPFRNFVFQLRCPPHSNCFAQRRMKTLWMRAHLVRSIHSGSRRPKFPCPTPIAILSTPFHPVWSDPRILCVCHLLFSNRNARAHVRRCIGLKFSPAYNPNPKSKLIGILEHLQ